jgi:hypothetical protein
VRRNQREACAWIAAAGVFAFFFTPPGIWLIVNGLMVVAVCAVAIRSVAGDAGVALVGASVVSAPIVFAALISAKRRHRSDQRARRRGRGLCAGCGYSLKGLTPDRCPECGEAIS